MTICRVKSASSLEIFLELLFDRSFTGSFSDFHFSFHFKLSGFLLPFIFLYLLSCKLIDITCGESVFADCAQEMFVGLEETCVFDEVIVAFDALEYLGLLVDFIDDGCVGLGVPLGGYF